MKIVSIHVIGVVDQVAQIISKLKRKKNKLSISSKIKFKIWLRGEEGVRDF